MQNKHTCKATKRNILNFAVFSDNDVIYFGRYVLTYTITVCMHDDTGLMKITAVSSAMSVLAH